MHGPMSPCASAWRLGSAPALARPAAVAMRVAFALRVRPSAASALCALFALSVVATSSANSAPLISAANARTAAFQPSTSPPVRSAILAPGPGRDLFVRVCTRCHAADLVTAKRRTPDEWDDLIAKMVDRGAMATDDEQQRIFEYLVRFYGERGPAGEQPPQTTGK